MRAAADEQGKGPRGRSPPAGLEKGNKNKDREKRLWRAPEGKRAKERSKQRRDRQLAAGRKRLARSLAPPARAAKSERFQQIAKSWHEPGIEPKTSMTLTLRDTTTPFMPQDKLYI